MNARRKRRKTKRKKVKKLTQNKITKNLKIMIKLIKSRYRKIWR